MKYFGDFIGKDKTSMLDKEKKGTAMLFSETKTKYGEEVLMYIETPNVEKGFNSIVLVPKDYEGQEQYFLEMSHRKKLGSTIHTHISNIEIPYLHHKGYSSLLLQTAIDFLKSNGCEVITTTIERRENDLDHLHALVNLYKKFGFIVNEEEFTAFKTL